jgi:pimeloyl-ACP methyl ester carboxylesterase
VRPFAKHFTVYVVNRPPGLPPSMTMAQLAEVYAHGLKAMFDGPVNALGISTGGSIALQLAADHPELVDRLILGGAAFTLGPIGKRAQRAYIQRAHAGKRPSPALAEAITGSPVGQRLLAGLLWLSDGGRKDYTDAISPLCAEDQFDLGGRLHEIRAATLIIQGEQDRPYPLELARRTAQAIPDAKLIVYNGVGHSGTFTDKRFARDASAFLLDGC